MKTLYDETATITLEQIREATRVLEANNTTWQCERCGQRYYVAVDVILAVHCGCGARVIQKPR